MAFTDALDVDIGDPTKASDYDTLADNTEFNREKADVDHDFDITTGDGYHNAEPTACFHLVSVADSVSASVFLDADGYPRIKINKVTVIIVSNPSDTLAAHFSGMLQTFDNCSAMRAVHKLSK